MTRVHHNAIVVADVDTSLRFWRDGIGLEVVMDQTFDGAWSELFGARSDRLRSVFLGEPGAADAGIVELVQFDGGADAAVSPQRPTEGFFLLSLFVDVDAVLDRLRRLGLGGEPRRIAVPSPNRPVAMATVRDPDGVLVELIGVAPGATQR
jgi:catechol 2,3-dioxygenase-like lactoylglutathione lyase family enzyme